MLSKEAILQFQAIYLAEYGKKISVKEAQIKASRLLNLYRAVYAKKKSISSNNNNHEKKLQPSKTGS